MKLVLSWIKFDNFKQGDDTLSRENCLLIFKKLRVRIKKLNFNANVMQNNFF